MCGRCQSIFSEWCTYFFRCVQCGVGIVLLDLSCCCFAFIRSTRKVRGVKLKKNHGCRASPPVCSSYLIVSYLCLFGSFRISDFFAEGFGEKCVKQKWESLLVRKSGKWSQGAEQLFFFLLRELSFLLLGSVLIYIWRWDHHLKHKRLSSIKEWVHFSTKRLTLWCLKISVANFQWKGGFGFISTCHPGEEDRHYEPFSWPGYDVNKIIFIQPKSDHCYP